MFSKLSLIILLVISPIWPLGENPLIGDPYIIVNKTTNELAFLVDGKVSKVYQVATGKTDLNTPEGEFNIVIKAVNPYYRKKDIVGGAKENPLGTRWIGFDALETDGRIYGVHGTNDPFSVGNYLTGGCVRMLNEEVEQLFNKVPLGTKVFITKTNLNFEKIGKEKGAIQ
ncbi:L,D-transpeptidase [Bacillaceae bacterium IKA-2]|nr:L,D-transpeptidase [Bacillaceae bacterium IKA-2]